MSGSAYEVAAVRTDEIRAVPCNGGPMRTFKFMALSALLDANSLKITYTPRDVVGGMVTSRRSLKPAQIECMKRRAHYVHSMIRCAPKNPCSQQEIQAHLKSIAAAINDQDPPGASTIANWIRLWREAGRDDMALVNRPKPSRVEFRNVPPKMLELCGQAVREVGLSPHRNRQCDVHAEALRLTANYNAETGEALEAPSRYLIDKLMKGVDSYERDRRRHGKAYADRHHRAAGRSFIAREPLEICMADGQHMDVMAVEERLDGGPAKVLGRPYVTVIIDVRTRCVLAAFVSLAPFSGGTLLKAMMKAVVASPGCPRGIPSTLIVDNGCDYQDSGFIRFIGNLDIKLEICKPHTPNGKAVVERFFRRLNEDLIHKLPGTTFSSPEARGDYRSQDLAMLTLKDIQGRVQTWIDEIYHQQPHRALGRAPIDVWNEETKTC